MDKEKLKRWSELLFDTGKRNNLINFKLNNRNILEVVFPRYNVLFEKLEHMSVFEIYNSQLSYVEDELEDDMEVAESYNIKILPKDSYIEIFSKNLLKNQVLIYDKLNKLSSTINNISKKSRTAIEETGVNILYMAFGFINWTESENSKVWMQAPILLIPISIEKKSAIDPYVVTISDNEFILNPTFSFKMQNEYNIELPAYNEEKGIESYFNDIEKLVGKLNWRVTKECVIACFSFLKINMYKDLSENADVILKNKSIRALLGEKSEIINVGDDNSTNNSDNPIILHSVIDADSSQEEAIAMAKMGRSFVLQGPPGTGKSQTITNIVAECLSDGKKVLFVSEKLAALNIVHQKLKQSNLDDFCLELHSHKTNKKQVIKELCCTLKQDKTRISDRADKEYYTKVENEKLLNEYVKELHKPRDIINKSIYNLLNEISACRGYESVDYIIRNLETKGEKYIEKAERILLRYVIFVSSIGDNYKNNIWFGFKCFKSTLQSKIILKNDFNLITNFCKSIMDVKEQIKLNYSTNLDTINYHHQFYKFCSIISKSKYLTPGLLLKNCSKEVMEILLQMQSLSSSIIVKSDNIKKIYNNIESLDAVLFYEKLSKKYKGLFARLCNKEYRKIMTQIKLCSNYTKMNYKKALKEMQNLSIYQRDLQKFNNLLCKVTKFFNLDNITIYSDFNEIVFELKSYIESEICSEVVSYFCSMRVDEFIEFKINAKTYLNHYNEIFESSEKAEDRIADSFNIEDLDIKNLSLSKLFKLCVQCNSNMDSLDNWCEFSKLLLELEELELKNYIDFTIKNNINPKSIPIIYKKTFYVQWVDYLLHDSPTLINNSRIFHDETVIKFKEKDKLNLNINKAKIRAYLYSLRPTLDLIAQGSSSSILLREGEKKRKQKSVRTLIFEIGNLIQTLKPCFLMSPLSVSTFLTANIKFDVTIFDEASQVFPQDAIGAIYRSKQLIVVGDSKQMPPSNFFGTSIIGDENEVDDLTDFESILDISSTVFSQLRLKWHYRSKNEDLISFSNKNFYNNELITFPSTMIGSVDSGVDFYNVQGVFDRKSRTNIIEANKTVDLIFEHIEKYPNRSLGVVAFSLSQQSLIERLVSKRRELDLSKEDFFKLDRSEPFFVKNLEAVQGDERDTIIFSVAYGKDVEGRLILNFGPLNKNGGERRLNVAITRAKINVKVVSSIHYFDIDLSRTQALGSKLLREYLDYAENGNIALQRTLTVNPFEHFDSEFELEVYEFLKDNGYVVETQVGCSSFKIDLAVKMPNTSKYVLAIECDGASYHSSKTARDRDRLRQDILEGMGWKFYRVWSTDWFRNSKVEKERLLNAVCKACDSVNYQVYENLSIDKDCDFNFVTKDKELIFPYYKEVEIQEICEKYKEFNRDYSCLIKYILTEESPISEEWLLKRTVYLFGREKITNIVRMEYESEINKCLSSGVVRKNGFLYLDNKEELMLRVPKDNLFPREISHISLEELAKGMEKLIQQNISCNKKGLFKLLASKLGFSRVGDSILKRFEKAFNLIPNVIIVNDQITIKTT